MRRKPGGAAAVVCAGAVKVGANRGLNRSKNGGKQAFCLVLGGKPMNLGDQTAKKRQRGKRNTPMARAWRWARSTIKNAWNIGAIA